MPTSSDLIEFLAASAGELVSSAECKATVPAGQCLAEAAELLSLAAGLVRRRQTLLSRRASDRLAREAA